MPSETNPSLIGRTVDSRYAIERKLASGGMGEVYLAADVHIGGHVVLKSPWPGMLLDDPGLRKRFIREIRIMRRLDHPSIVRVHDVTEHDGRPVGVIQYCSGGDLGSQPDLPLEKWLPPIADALDYLHRRKLVHRDVKPGNIFFDSHGAPYLGDFGIVKSLDGATTAFATLHGATQTGFALGTPEYMSPEAVEGQDLDGRADQYSLAVMVYERLAGRTPFDATTPAQYFAAHLMATPHLLSTIDGRFGEAISQVFQRVLSKRPADRFPSCREFAVAVLQALGLASVPSSSPQSPPPASAAVPTQTPASTPTPTPAAMVHVSTTPAGAAVIIDRQLRGRSPLALPLTAGEYHLRVELEGYLPVERRISHDARRNVYSDIALKRSGQISVDSERTAVRQQYFFTLFAKLKQIERGAFVPGFLAFAFTTTRERILGMGIMAGAGTVTGIFLGWGIAGIGGGAVLGVIGGVTGATIGRAIDWAHLVEQFPEDTPEAAFVPTAQVTPTLGKAYAARSDRPHAAMAEGLPIEITNSIGMKLVLIPPGEFTMGSPQSETGRENNEGPQHRVRITQRLYLGVYPVTQEQYGRVMATNPSRFQASAGIFSAFYARRDAPTQPVERVNWYDAMEFCRRLSATEGRTYRLPTEAEWEYACRAGTVTPFYFGHLLNGHSANCDGNYPYGTLSSGPYLGRPTQVGAYCPNGFAVYDMHGNVWEWCADWFHNRYYETSPLNDPRGPASGSYRIVRGGSWFSSAASCRSAYRLWFRPDTQKTFLGFRVVLSAKD